MAARSTPAFAAPLALAARPRSAAPASCALPAPRPAAPRRAPPPRMGAGPPPPGDPDAAPTPPAPAPGAGAPPPEPSPGLYDEMKREGVSEADMQAQAAKANAGVSGKAPARNLFREDGTPYAPWMAGYPTDYDNRVVKSKTDARGKLAADPQLAEQSGVGVAWKMLGDELELAWSTGAEEGNVGFVVSRRRGREAEWAKVADYSEAPAELASKGPAGGNYSFIVPDPQPGSWVYRISDVDGAGNVSDLSQTLVEIESAEDQNGRLLALGILLGVLAAALFAGLSLDPLSST